MKRILISSILFGALCFSSCSKTNSGCQDVDIAVEEPTIVSYGTSNSLSLTRHPTGVYYEIINPGSSTTPTTSSKVFIKYVGKLLNGTTFDQQTNAALTGWFLRDLIPGWQVGLPLIGKGGKIKLVIPSAYAYGCNGIGSIPANSILYFDIDLVDVQ
jgi:FKBP-type peptidyl-prolyl cis-trans isomerase FkpA